MEVLKVPGGWYCDAIPSGEYAVVVPTAGNIITHLGTLTHPNGLLPYYVRVSKNPSFQFAGQSNGSYATLQYINGSWQDINKVACGINCVIYDNSFDLHISDCSAGVQGWRYCDYDTGALVTGDDTTYYAPGTLYEYSYLGEGLYIGQGNEGGCILWDGTNHRLIYEGAPYTVKFNRVNQDVVISFYDGPGGLPPTAVIIWATMDELRNLPVVGAPQPVWTNFSAVFQRAGNDVRLVDPTDNLQLSLGKLS